MTEIINKTFPKLDLNKKIHFILSSGTILLISFLLRFYGIEDQPLIEFENHMAQGAIDYVNDGLMPLEMWWHPPLRNFLIYLSTNILGFDSVGIRLWSLVLGFLTVPMTALLAFKLFNDKRISLIAAFLLGLDPLHITFSRQAIQETHVGFFAVSAVYFTLKYLKNESILSIIMAGLLFGMGLASKWQAGFTLAACWLLLVFPKMVEGEKISSHPLYVRLITAISMLIFLPFSVYIITYLPWFFRGYDLPGWLYLQKISFFLTKDTTSSFDFMSNPSKAIDWFFKLSGYADIVVTDRPHLTFAVNNLLVWWFIIPSFVYMAYRIVKRKGGNLMFAFLLFFFSYIPFIVLSRPIWLLSATSVIPFAFLGLSWAISKTIHEYNKDTRWLYGYLLLVFIVSIALFPLTCGKAFDYFYLAPIINKFSPY